MVELTFRQKPSPSPPLGHRGYTAHLEATLQIPAEHLLFSPSDGAHCLPGASSAISVSFPSHQSMRF